MGRTSAPLRCGLGKYQFLNTVDDETGLRTYVWTDFRIDAAVKKCFNRAAGDVTGIVGIKVTDHTKGVGFAVVFDDGVPITALPEKLELLFERFNARLGVPPIPPEPMPIEQIEAAMAVFGWDEP